MALNKATLWTLFPVIGSHQFPTNSVVTFGTHTIYCPYNELISGMFRSGLTPAPLTPEQRFQNADRYEGVDRMSLNGNVMLRMLGFDEIVNLDVLPHTPEAYLHNLSTPVPEDLHGKFSLLIDSSTGFHVFNQATALENAINLLQEGGMVVHTSSLYPGNAHFPAFTPQLLTRFYEENGFDSIRVFFCSTKNETSAFEWVGDPHYTFNLKDLHNYYFVFTAIKRETKPISTDLLEWQYEILRKVDPVPSDESLKGKNVAIWGTGGNYTDNYRELVMNDNRSFNMLGFITSAEGEWGKQLDGHPIYSPAQIADLPIDVLLLASWDKSTLYNEACKVLFQNTDALRETFQLHRYALEQTRSKSLIKQGVQGW